MSFKEFLEHFSYLSIGHNFTGNYDAWIMRNNELIIDKKNPDYLHDSDDDFQFKGRIDHNIKAISITSGSGDKHEIPYLISSLKEKFPGYTIWFFTYGKTIRVA